MEVEPLPEPTFSMAWTTSRPSTTWPKTTCLPSNQPVFSVQMKNWEPLLMSCQQLSPECWRIRGTNYVLGPALAMERIPAPVCFRVKFSSLNFSP